MLIMGDLSEGYMGIILGSFLQTQSYPPENREGRGQGRLCGLTVSDLQEKGIQVHKAGEQSRGEEAERSSHSGVQGRKTKIPEGSDLGGMRKPQHSPCRDQE